MSAADVPIPAPTTPAPRRESPGARLLREHSAECERCQAVILLQIKPTALCGRGKWLYVAAKRAVAPRRRP